MVSQHVYYVYGLLGYWSPLVFCADDYLGRAGDKRYFQGKSLAGLYSFHEEDGAPVVICIVYYARDRRNIPGKHSGEN